MNMENMEGKETEYSGLKKSLFEDDKPMLYRVCNNLCLFSLFNL